MSFIITAAVIGGGVSMYNSSKNRKAMAFKDLRTPEQVQAQQGLAQLGQTGSYGGINLGEAYGGSLGNFDMTGIEGQGLEGLQQLLQGGNSQDVQGARSTFQNLADTTFDPSDPKSGYASFQRQLARSGKESEDILSRNEAIQGSRFSTAAGQSRVDLAERMQDIRGGKLAELFQSGRQQQLAGAQGLAGLADSEHSRKAQSVEMATRLGGLQRDLKNQEAQAKFSEFQRQRGETLARLDLMSNTANINPYSGISSLPGSPSAFSGLANSVLGYAGERAIDGYFDKQNQNTTGGSPALWQQYSGGSPAGASGYGNTPAGYSGSKTYFK